MTLIRRLHLRPADGAHHRRGGGLVELRRRSGIGLFLAWDIATRQGRTVPVGTAPVLLPAVLMVDQPAVRTDMTLIRRLHLRPADGAHHRHAVTSILADVIAGTVSVDAVSSHAPAVVMIEPTAETALVKRLVRQDALTAAGAPTHRLTFGQPTTALGTELKRDAFRQRQLTRAMVAFPVHGVLLTNAPVSSTRTASRSVRYGPGHRCAGASGASRGHSPARAASPQRKGRIRPHAG